LSKLADKAYYCDVNTSQRSATLIAEERNAIVQATQERPTGQPICCYM